MRYVTEHGNNHGEWFIHDNEIAVVFNKRTDRFTISTNDLAALLQLALRTSDEPATEPVLRLNDALAWYLTRTTPRNIGTVS